MRHFTKVETMSELTARADEILEELATSGQPVLITQNGEAKAVLQDIRSFERTQETLALLNLLALGQREVDAGKLTPARDVIARLKLSSAATRK